METNSQNNNFNDLIPPDNNMVWAILSTFFCCLPLGIVSIIKANSVNSLWAQKRYDEARIASDDAMKFAKYSALAAVLVWVLYVVAALILGIGTAFANN